MKRPTESNNGVCKHLKAATAAAAAAAGGAAATRQQTRKQQPLTAAWCGCGI